MAKIEILQQKGYNFLWVDDNLWMWDIPEEINEQRQVANLAYGNVMVAGYGLGVIQRCLLENSKVTDIISIEQHMEVIKKCKEIYGRIYGDIMILDFFDVIVGEEEYEKMDCVIGDIWVEYTQDHLPEYVRFKKKAQTLIKPGGRVLAWGQDYLEHLLQKKGV